MVFVGAVCVLFIAFSFAAVVAPAPWLIWINAVGLLSLANVGTVPFTRAIGHPPYSQAGFFGLSAIASAWLSTDREWLPAASLLAVMGAGLIFAWLLGTLFRRMQKWQIVVTTLALAAVMLLIGFGLMPREGAFIRNVPVMESFGIVFIAQPVFIAMTWVLLVALIWTVTNVFDAFVGRSLVVAQEDEALADEYGIDTLAKARGFYVLATAPALLAGWIFAFWMRSIGQEVVSAPFLFLCVAVCMAAAWLGPWGAVIGSALLTLPLALLSLPSAFMRWDTNVIGLAGVAGCVGLMWRYCRPISKWFQNLRRKLDPHEIDLGMVDERSGMKAHGVPPPGTEVLRLDEVTMGESTRPPVQAVSFAVHVGEALAIVCDRVETRRALLALLSGTVLPRKGDILVWGESGKAIAAQHWGRHGISRTHQPPRLINDFHVIDNVTVGLSSRLPMSLAAAMVRANMADERVARSEAMYHLSRVWMREEAQTFVKDLSPSRQQMVELARALTADPALLVLDNMGKTIAGSDREIVLKFIADLNETGVAVVILDDDWEFARAASRNMIVIESGSVIAEGPTERVLATAEMRGRVAQFGRDSRANPPA
jgi:branched-chain amino acid transport system permease protein